MRPHDGSLIGTCTAFLLVWYFPFINFPNRWWSFLDHIFYSKDGIFWNIILKNGMDTVYTWPQKVPKFHKDISKSYRYMDRSSLVMIPFNYCHERSEWPIWNAIHFSFPYLVVLIQIKWGGAEGPRGGWRIWAINYAQTKTPINMKFGMQVRFSAIYNEFLSKFPYLSYFRPYGQKYILIHFYFQRTN